MPNWRKVIISGSDASLNSMYLDTTLTASIISASNGIHSGYVTSSDIQNAGTFTNQGSALFKDEVLILANLIVTGSINTTAEITAEGGFTGSLEGTASYAVSASWAPGANDEQRDLNSQTVTNYILALTDANDSITMNNAAANRVTIPTNASVAFPIGTVITVWMLGAGVTSITADTGVTLSGNGGTAVAGSCAIQTQYNAATLLKIDTNSWLVSGNINAVS